MSKQVIAPRIYHSRLKGDNKQVLPTHRFSQLIGSKGFSKAHFGIPKEVRYMPLSWRVVLKEISCNSYRSLLFRAHCKTVIASRISVVLPRLFTGNTRFEEFYATAKPLAIFTHYPHTLQATMNFVVGKEGAVIANSKLIEFYTPRLFGLFHGFSLLAHALFGSAGSITHL